MQEIKQLELQRCVITDNSCYQRTLFVITLKRRAHISCISLQFNCTFKHKYRHERKTFEKADAQRSMIVEQFSSRRCFDAFF
jgi:hypothetical protein